ncbi:hypothetical protein, partial [Escherichia coli]|uniref:hypothetical protein n=1 Tax=Escherichia coli TaxID=562 RepID=UPI00141327B0
ALSNQLSNEEEKRKLVEEHAMKKASSELQPTPISNGGTAVAVKPVSTVSTDVRVYQPYDLEPHILRNHSVAHIEPYINMQM